MRDDDTVCALTYLESTNELLDGLLVAREVFGLGSHHSVEKRCHVRDGCGLPCRLDRGGVKEWEGGEGKTRNYFVCYEERKPFTPRVQSSHFSCALGRRTRISGKSVGVAALCADFVR